MEQNTRYKKTRKAIIFAAATILAAFFIIAALTWKNETTHAIVDSEKIIVVSETDTVIIPLND